MGTDIHVWAEKIEGTGYAYIPGVKVFEWRHYGQFGFLADVRNYSGIEPLSQPRGLPIHVSKDVIDCLHGKGYYSFSWYGLSELLAVDYEKEVEDLRCVEQIGENMWNHGATAEPGRGKKMTLREFLGLSYFHDLKVLQEAGADRIIFCFDC